MSKGWRGDLNVEGLAIISEKGAVKGLRLAAGQVLTDARRYVPIEEGTLERSGKVSVDEGDLKASVSFDTPYAVRQHEDMTARHDAGRTAKYLERAFDENKDQIREIIAQAMRDALHG